MKTYANSEEFYHEDPRRRSSGEADYGVWWLADERSRSHWRVSYVHATGEVYAVELGGAGPVEVLGIVPPDEEHVGPHHRPWERYYRTLDKILEGWAEHCGQPGGLKWVKERLEGVGCTPG
ncbi:MAG: hypothetical protein Q8N61_01690 [bacterium]|nr:hypothetical protein [bacterium]